MCEIESFCVFSSKGLKYIYIDPNLSLLALQQKVCCNINLMLLPFTIIKFFIVIKLNHCHFALVLSQRQ